VGRGGNAVNKGENGALSRKTRKAAGGFRREGSSLSASKKLEKHKREKNKKLNEEGGQ